MGAKHVACTVARLQQEAWACDWVVLSLGLGLDVPDVVGQTS